MPRSLAGQMALLVAIALFAAQAVNFALIVRDRSTNRIQQAAAVPALRIADAIEREAEGRPSPFDRGRIRRLAVNPIPADLPRREDVAQAVSANLARMNVAVGRVDAAMLHGAPEARRDTARAQLRDRAHGPRRMMLIAVEQPGHGWLVMRAQWPAPGPAILGWLIAQTLILYVIVLVPVLWLARRISRPLRALALDAQRFSLNGDAAAVPEQGPADVRSVIAAYNSLGIRVRAMLEEKDRMLGAIGHDLRTPLAALRVRIESVEDEADRARMADTIAEMNRTLDDILSLARLGRPSEPLTEVDLAALVDAVVEDFRDLGHAVTFDEAARLPVRLRPSLIRRAVRNLIENAVKYAGAAEVSVVRGIDAVSIMVADRGPGIPPERIADVFEPFTRLESSRNRDTGGIGLGLALARAIVREARGEIVLANRDGGGLEATLTLPIR
ncbi:MAG: ATP-binding protein [Candidatus Sphingomonas colombiensis]|nr:ATP-binding protein [Sphingomonas sp.]WEK43485.1 MAG: ATP-binding protein [Sphingomonas sp.]